jgi:hypothetical protein
MTAVAFHDVPTADGMRQYYQMTGYEYRGADKSLALPTYRCILSDGENISFDASLVLYIYI